MELIRRLPRAVLVTVLCLLFFGGTTGLVVAAGDPEVPDRMAVARPHVGDRWQYELESHVEMPGYAETQRMPLAYEWLDSELVQDAEGRWHTVQPLFEQWGFGREPEWTAYLVDVATDEVVATRDRLAGQGNSISRSAFGGVSISEQTSQEFTEHLTTRFGPFPPFCGYRHDMQGQAVALGDARLDGFCGMDLDHPEGVAFSARFQPVETEEVAGMQTVRLHRSDELAKDVEFHVDIWLAPHIPYPVLLRYSMEFEVPDMGSLGVEMTMRMTGFEPGPAPWGQALALPTAAVPDIRTAEHRPWGPDDSAILHAFPFSQAWMVAQDHGASAEWFDDHPGAAAFEANFTQIAFEDRTELRWIAWVADKNDQRRLEVAQTVRDDEPAALLQSLTGDIQVTLEESTKPMPDKMPTFAPTVQSVQMRWQTMRPDAGPANAYGFWPSCSCPDAYWVVSGGRVHAEDSAPAITNPVDPAPTEFTEQRDALIVGALARPEALQSMARHGSTYESGLVALGAQANPNQADGEELAAMEMTSAVWGFPPAPAAAGVVAGAFVFGLLYWLWPAIKSGGAMGLFSRVEKDKLLEHPVRRTIHDAIQANPGIHYQALIRTIGKGRGTVEHHIHKLEAGGYVVAHRNQGHTCFFVRGSMDHSVMAAVPAVRTAAAARVLSHIQDHPGLRVGEVGQALGLARSTASHHVGRLKEAGLVTSWANGGLSATAIAAPALHAVAA